MKQRIRKEIDGYTLKATYHPQYKWVGLFWLDYSQDEIVGNNEMTFAVYFGTEEEAREYLAKKRAEKCTSISYIDI